MTEEDIFSIYWTKKRIVKSKFNNFGILGHKMVVMLYREEYVRLVAHLKLLIDIAKRHLQFVGAFLLQKRKGKKMPFIDVNCPRCGIKVFKVIDRTKNSLSAKCVCCKKLITYHGKDRTVTIGELPERRTSSGTRFY